MLIITIPIIAKMMPRILLEFNHEPPSKTLRIVKITPITPIAQPSSNPTMRITARCRILLILKTSEVNLLCFTRKFRKRLSLL